MRTIIFDMSSVMWFVFCMNGIARKPKKCLYTHISSEKCKEAMRHDTVVGRMGPAALFEKYKNLVAKPFTKGSFRQLITRWGWGTARVIVRNAVDQLELEKEAAIALANRVKERMVAGADIHFDRMEKIIDKAHNVIKDIEPDQLTVGSYLDKADQYDKLGRRLYRMDEQKPMTAQQINVSMLIGLGRQLTDEAQGVAVEAQVVE